jgi:hypothetical protein
VLEAVKQFGYAIQLASGNLKGDKEFMLEAAKQFGDALQLASEEPKRMRRRRTKAS